MDIAFDATVLLWWLIYSNLAAFGRWFTYSLLNMPQGGHLSSAVEFFVFETPKVLMLLVLIVFGIGIVRSFFTPEKTRKILSGKSEAVGNILAALLGCGYAFLFVLGCAFVRRVL